jgi:hypothetical protein
VEKMKETTMKKKKMKIEIKIKMKETVRREK